MKSKRRMRRNPVVGNKTLMYGAAAVAALYLFGRPKKKVTTSVVAPPALAGEVSPGFGKVVNPNPALGNPPPKDDRVYCAAIGCRPGEPGYGKPFYGDGGTGYV